MRSNASTNDIIEAVAKTNITTPVKDAVLSSTCGMSPMLSSR